MLDELEVELDVIFDYFISHLLLGRLPVIIKGDPDRRVLISTLCNVEEAFKDPPRFGDGIGYINGF